MNARGDRQAAYSALDGIGLRIHDSGTGNRLPLQQYNLIQITL